MIFQTKTFLVLFGIFKLNIIKLWADDSKKCSGIGSVWNPNTSSCYCGTGMWGSRCQYGRRRITDQHGFLKLAADEYENESKYIFLVDSGRNDTSIKFVLNEFATECMYDSLYIFDGRSVYAPLLASFSGVIKSSRNPCSLQNDVITVKSTSGAALLYFFSDKHITDFGFNVTYQISSCNQTFCSNNGLCINSKNCTCDAFWTGEFCSVRTEPACCLSFNLVSKEKTCELCSDDLKTFALTARASHAMAIIDSSLFIYGGYSFNNKKLDKLIKYDLITYSFKEYETGLPSRYDHSMVAYGDKLIVFGGISLGKVTNEILKYESVTNSWSVLNCAGDTPIAVYGHASVVVNGIMYTFFGYNDIYFVHHVQTLDLTTNTWSLVKTSGDNVSGSYKHSASYDVKTDVVFIYGGFKKDKKATSQLLLFHVSSRKWTKGLSSKVPLMLHASAIIGRNLIIFGGSANNTTDEENTLSECHSKDVLVYNIDCRSWSYDENLLHSKGRYGHGVITYNKCLYVVGGFNGIFLGDLFKITIKGDCSQYTNLDKCLSAPLIAGCVWTNDGVCSEANHFLPESSIKRPVCTDICSTMADCVSCTTLGCSWNKENSLCIQIPSSNLSSVIVSTEKCDLKAACSKFNDCNECNENSYCTWSDQNSCIEKNADSVNVECFQLAKDHNCKDIKDCKNCTNTKPMCIWCESQQQCVNSKTYPLSFPYGQCQEWISDRCENVKCELQVTCQKCFQLPGCGWCDDGSGTGLGWCSTGTDDGPFDNTCKKKSWYFTNCPACNCHGHSKCSNISNICEDCADFTEGINCEKCKFGFFGNPENNNSCKACNCNGHMLDCKADGICLCDLKGAIGNQCERCDISKEFLGNATNGGFCYTYLEMGLIRYSHNISGYTVIAFAVTLKEDSDVKIEIKQTNGSFALLNFSIFYSDQTSLIIAEKYQVGYYLNTIKKELFINNGEARMVLYGWKKKDYFAFDISAVPPPQVFDLVYFLIMFMVCFCSLVIILIILWKVKQRYDIYLRNRQQQQEHKVRINRPFKSMSIVLPQNRCMQREFSYVAFEPFANQLYGVASVLVQLPRGDNSFTPRGQCGLCIGSTVTFLPHRWSLSQIHQKYSQSQKMKSTESPV